MFKDTLAEVYVLFYNSTLLTFKEPSKLFQRENPCILFSARLPAPIFEKSFVKFCEHSQNEICFHSGGFVIICDWEILRLQLMIVSYLLESSQKVK